MAKCGSRYLSVLRSRNSYCKWTNCTPVQQVTVPIFFSCCLSHPCFVILMSFCNKAIQYCMCRFRHDCSTCSESAVFRHVDLSYVTVFDPAISDLSVVPCTLSLPKTAFERRYICYRKLKSMSMVELHEDIENSPLIDPVSIYNTSGECFPRNLIGSSISGYQVLITSFTSFGRKKWWTQFYQKIR